MMYIFILALLFCAPAEDADIQSAIPSDAQFFIYMHSVGEISEGFHASAWGQFMADPQVRAIRDFLVEKVLLFEIPEDEGEYYGLFSELLKSPFSGSLALYLTMENFQTGGGVVLAAPGEDRKSFNEFLSKYKKRLDDSEAFTDSAESYNDMDILLWEESMLFLDWDESSESESEEWSEEWQERAIIFVDTGEVAVFLFQPWSEESRATGIAEVQRILDQLSGEGESRSILDSEEFMALKDRFPGSHDIELYMNLGGYVQSFKDLLIDMEENDSLATIVLNGLGLDDISSLYSTVNLGEGETLDLSLFVGIAGEGLIRQIVDCAAGEPPKDLLATIPADAIALFITPFDLPGMYKKMMEEFESKFEEGFNEYRQLYTEFVINRLKIDPEKEILPLLDSNLSLYSMEISDEELAALQGFEVEERDEGGGGGLLLFNINDRETFQANLEKTLRALGVYVSMKKVDFQGHRIYSIQTPLSGMRLFWIYREDLFAISLFPSVIRSYIRLLTQEGQPSIQGDKDCMRFIETYPDADTISLCKTSDVILSYLKLAKILRAYEQKKKRVPMEFEELIPLEVEEQVPMEAEDKAEEPLPPIPGKDVVDKYFKGRFGIFLMIDDEGLRIAVITR